MTVKLSVVYGTPADPEAFDKHYTEVHVPIVRRWPNVQRIEVARVTGGLMGSPSPYHLITEIYFADEAALNEALGSDAGAEAAKDFANLTTDPGAFMTVSTVLD